MPELTLISAPPRQELRSHLRGRLAQLVPGLRVVAEGLLGAEAPIDFVGIDPEGRTLLVLVGLEGGDLELVARALAQRSWVEPRLRDWLQLAPELGLRPEVGLATLLLCPSFGPESLAAARALGAEAPRLATYRCVRNGTGVEVLLEPLGQPAAATRSASPPQNPSPPRALPAFRTGLSDADLDLTADERRAFE